VKRRINLKYHLIAGVIALLAIVTSCYESNDLGMELLPSTDLIEVKNLVEKNNISSFTYTDGPIRTDEPPKSLLGSFYDPIFGLSTINFATQFRLQDFPDFGTNPVADSVKLFLYYRLMYGDTVTPQRFRVYELETPLNVDQDYRQDVNLEAMAYDQLLGELIYKPVVRIDSASRDTFYQLITIPLDISLGEKLVNADSSQMINNDRFLEFFKGLLIESEDQAAPGGSILTLEAASSNIFQGSALVVYYNNEENRNKETPDTMLNPYVITQFSARVNSIEHDYSGTPFEANLNVDAGEDSLIYIQATGGLKSKIYIEGLASWQDSVNTAINKAELIFQVDTIATDMERFPPPSQLLFTFVDNDGNEQLPNDYWFSPAYYGGQLRTSDYTYRFNITQHLQRILDGEVGNNGFFLSVARKNSEASRVILKGSESQTGIRMVITYSKFMQ
jgi:hypothetical protein